jgi:sodium/proline symporter
VIATIASGLLFTVLWSVTGMNAHITSRLLTFFVAGAAAIIATFALPKKASPPLA